MATKTKTKTKSTGMAGRKVRNAKERVNTAPSPADDTKQASGRQSSAKSTDTVAALKKADSGYLRLIARFPLRPIRTEIELDEAAAVIDELTDRDDLSTAESDYLDVLGDLVEKYEEEHVEMPHVSDAAMLRSLMSEKGVKQADIVWGTRISKTVVSLVLSGKRDLTREHVMALAKYFEVNPAAFLGPA